MSDYSIAIKIAGQLEGSFKQALKGAQNGLSGLGVAGKVGGAAVKATAATITTAGAAIGAVGAYSANVGKDFESAMSSVAATADASAEEYTKLENAAREMGRTTSKTAAESANALEYMSLAGWDVDKSISALPSVLRLSEASGMDLARCSDLVTDSMSALGDVAGELPDYLDVVAKSQNKSNQSAEQLMEAYLNVGGTMKDLGVPIEESAAALGVMANRGRKGGEAGQALSAIMANLTTGTGQAGKMPQGRWGALHQRLPLNRQMRWNTCHLQDGTWTNQYPHSPPSCAFQRRLAWIWRDAQTWLQIPCLPWEMWQENCQTILM